MFKEHYFYKASDIFSIAPIVPKEGMPSIANLRISKKDQVPKLTGCGLYFILYQNKLVYIGKFLGTKSNAFSGDLFTNRWSRHIATLAIRGKGISIGQSLASRFILENPGHQLSQILSKSNSDLLAKDRGCVVSVNRFKFAALNWESFSNNENRWIHDFKFGYLQLSKDDFAKFSTEEIRNKVNKAESNALNQFKPILNKSGLLFEYYEPTFIFDSLKKSYDQI